MFKKGVPKTISERESLRVPHKVNITSRFLEAQRESHSRPEYRKKMSESQKRRFLLHPEQHPSRILASRGKMSYPQKKLFGIVKDWHKEEIVMNYPVKTGKSLKLIDVAIPELKVGYEYDSKYWHKNLNRDIARDEELTSLGWMVFHTRFNEGALDILWIAIPEKKIMEGSIV